MELAIVFGGALGASLIWTIAASVGWQNAQRTMRKAHSPPDGRGYSLVLIRIQPCPNCGTLPDAAHLRETINGRTCHRCGSPRDFTLAHPAPGEEGAAM